MNWMTIDFEDARLRRVRPNRGKYFLANIRIQFR